MLVWNPVSSGDIGDTLPSHKASRVRVVEADLGLVVYYWILYARWRGASCGGNGGFQFDIKRALMLSQNDGFGAG